MAENKTNKIFSNKTRKSNNTRKSINVKKNIKTKKNKTQFGGSKCKDFLINFELNIDEIKQIISNNKDKKTQPYVNILRQIYELLNDSFIKIDENCDDISSKRFQEILNKVKDLKNYDRIGIYAKPEYIVISNKTDEIIGKIEFIKSIMESKELKKREIEELKKREIEELKELEKRKEAQKKEFNRLESERLKKEADERKQKVAEEAKRIKAEEEAAKKIKANEAKLVQAEAKRVQKAETKRIQEAEEAKRLQEAEAKRVQKAEEAKRLQEAEAKRVQEAEAKRIQEAKEAEEARRVQQEIKRREAEEDRIKMQKISEEKQAAEKAEFENLPKIDLLQFLTPNDNGYLKELFMTDIFEKITNIFPNIATDYSQDFINNLENYDDQDNYNHISSFIIILIGVLNNRLKIAKSNIKFVLKGGKSAQMMISKNNIKDIHILSDDIDILVLFDGKYNRLYVKNISEQLADIIGYYVNMPKYKQLISILKPDNNPTNPNIVKISFINSINGRFFALSDIDFKQIETPFFDSLEETTQNLYMDNQFYQFDLLYYHQNIQSFIDEKRFYLDKYSNIIQQTETGEMCDCNKPSGNCIRTCSNRIRMIDKFNKYIAPLEQLSEFIKH